MISTVIADPHPVVRTGLRSFLENTPFQVVAEAASAEETLQTVRRYSPNLLLLEGCFVDQGGLKTVHTLRTEGYNGRVALLMSNYSDFFLARSLEVGVDCCLLKNTTQSEMLQSLSLIMEVPCAFSGELGRVADWVKKRKTSGYCGLLTYRESQVLELITNGLSNKKIAASMGIGLDTVKEHVRNIFRKLNVRDRTEAAVWALRNDFLT